VVQVQAVGADSGFLIQTLCTAARLALGPNQAGDAGVGSDS